MRKKTMKQIGTVMLCALSFAACGKAADAGTLESTLGPERAGEDDGEEAGGFVAGSGGEQEEKNAPGDVGASGVESGGLEPGTDGEQSGKNTQSNEEPSVQGEDFLSVPKISFEILSDTRTDDAGNVLVTAQYPVFSVSGEGYEALSAALASWNEEWRSQAGSFLDDTKDWAGEYRESIDPDYCFLQESNAAILRCDWNIVSILVTRTVEEGGPHPNNYSDARNFDVRTGEVLKLSDVVSVDDALTEKIKEALYADYPELDFDEAALAQEIPEALANEALEWYFRDGQICVCFREGSFGFGHAEGSLAVLIQAEGGV